MTAPVIRTLRVMMGNFDTTLAMFFLLKHNISLILLHILLKSFLVAD